MTFGGWVCMIGAVGFVTAIFGWCCWKVITTDDSGSGADGSDDDSSFVEATDESPVDADVDLD